MPIHRYSSFPQSGHWGRNLQVLWALAFSLSKLQDSFLFGLQPIKAEEITLKARGESVTSHPRQVPSALRSAQRVHAGPMAVPDLASFCETFL